MFCFVIVEDNDAWAGLQKDAETALQIGLELCERFKRSVRQCSAQQKETELTCEGSETCIYHP